MTGRTAGWGWEIIGINNAGADALLPVVAPIRLDSINVDLAFMPTAAPAAPGYAEVLCRGYVLASAPSIAGGAAPISAPRAAEFGSATVQNPNGFTVAQSSQVDAGVLFNVILKAWVASPPVASPTARNVSIFPAIDIPAGAVIALHMDHMGVPGDVEMQIVISY